MIGFDNIANSFLQNQGQQFMPMAQNSPIGNTFQMQAPSSIPLGQSLGGLKGAFSQLYQNPMMFNNISYRGY